MAIDFYYLGEKNYKKPLFQIEEDDLLLIEDSLINLQKLTGVDVDAYGKTRIYPDHIKLWLKLLNDSLAKREKLKTSMPKIFDLKDFLTKIIQADEGLMIIGD